MNKYKFKKGDILECINNSWWTDSYAKIIRILYRKNINSTNTYTYEVLQSNSLSDYPIVVGHTYNQAASLIERTYKLDINSKLKYIIDKI
jgi:hypothetical protein